MKSQKPMPLNIPCSSWQLFIIILLGAGGLLSTLRYLTGDIKMAQHSRKCWVVRDSTIKGAPLRDIFEVTIHPQNLSQTIPPANIKGDVEWSFSILYMTYNPAFLVWMALIAVMVGVSLALLPVIIKTISDIYKQSDNLKPVNIITAITIAVIIGFCIDYTNKNPYVLMLFDIMEKGEILLEHPQNLNYTILLCLAAGLTAIAGQLIINYEVGFMPKSIYGFTPDNQKKAANKFTLLRNSLKFFLMVDAVLVVFSIITTDTLRKTVNQELSITTTNKSYEIMPQQFVYLYGMVFTLYLGLLYLPVYYQLKSKGEEMAKSIQAENDENNKLSVIFLLKESPIESLKIALSVLAPVLSSLLPGIVNF